MSAAPWAMSPFKLARVAACMVWYVFFSQLKKSDLSEQTGACRPPRATNPTKKTQIDVFSDKYGCSFY